MRCCGPGFVVLVGPCWHRVCMLYRLKVWLVTVALTQENGFVSGGPGKSGKSEIKECNWSVFDG